jgi:ADP-heptose:LPS heptosyltransferase
VAGLKQTASRPIVAINLGVGDNESKRAGDNFESGLVAGLIQRGARLILDKGAGVDEAARIDRIIRDVTRAEPGGRRIKTVEMSESAMPDATGCGPADILVWNGRVGLVAALIGESDLYIGYDSAGQHIAAALGVPCIDVFTSFSSNRFIERWRPSGKAETRLVVASGDAVDQSRLLSEVLGAAHQVLQGC